MDNERRCKSTRAQLSLLISTRVCRPYISHFDNIKSRFHPPLAAALRGEVLPAWTMRNRVTHKYYPTTPCKSAADSDGAALVQALFMS